MIRSLLVAGVLCAGPPASAPELQDDKEIVTEEQREAVERGHIGVTALAGMAFLAGGHLPGRGEYGPQIEKALDFISRNRSKPFFLYVAHSMPHVPLFVSDKFKGKSKQGLYGDVIMEIDWSVGQILSALRKHRIDRNTLVLFTSDNGPWLSYGNHGGSAGPLREGKGTTWEGGQRVPCIVRWPDRIKAGSRSVHPIAFADALATFAKAAGRGELPEGMAEDSVSFLPVLLHPDRKHPPRPPILHEGKVIRDGAWKLIATRGGRGFDADRKVKYGTELYNLKDDISEKNNLAEKMPEKVKNLQTRMYRILNK